jgi:ADP-ribose pyrophosphatase YjhB (NUDIX family)
MASDHHQAHHAGHGHVQYRFCPKCGGGLEKKIVKNNEPGRLVCQSCAFIFYQDPKVVAGTVFTLNGGIVLLKRGVEPALGKWVFPGGYVDRGEEITLAALREAREEAGIDVRLDHLVNIYSYAGRSPVIVVYAATMISGELAVDDEGLEIREFGLDEIPWDDLAFRSTREALRDYIDGRVTAPVK